LSQPTSDCGGFILIKAFIPAVVLASALAAPVVSFAQESNAPLTRAQVRAQLVQTENAGYEPAGGAGPYYPAHFQAAEARMEAQNAASSSNGGVGSGSLASRASTPLAGTKRTGSGS
jgi:Domain of unknown function (DUF4148)